MFHYDSNLQPEVAASDATNQQDVITFQDTSNTEDQTPIISDSFDQIESHLESKHENSKNNRQNRSVENVLRYSH